MIDRYLDAGTMYVPEENGVKEECVVTDEGGVIVLSALASKLIFKEKITSKEWISVAGAFVSTLLFAF